MGATTHQAMYRFASSGEPGTDTLTDVPKVVFSSTLTEPLEWANSTLVTQDPVEAERDITPPAPNRCGPWGA